MAPELLLDCIGSLCRYSSQTGGHSGSSGRMTGMTQRIDIVEARGTGKGPAATDAVRLRPFEPSDLPAAQALSSTLNWPHRIEDWQLALSLGHGVVAECDRTILGTALACQF